MTLINKSSTQHEPRILKASSGHSFVGYQIYYDAFSQGQLDPGFTPYFNEEHSPFLENFVIEKLIQQGAHKATDYFGVFSWKAGIKLGRTAAEIFEAMESDGFSHDIYTFNFEWPTTRLWNTQADREQSRISDIAQLLMTRLGIAVDVRELETPIIIQNHFICRSSLYEAYVWEMLSPAMDILSDKNDSEMQALLNHKTQYSVTPGLEDRLRRIFGDSVYMLHPFICERLFGTWIALKAPSAKPKIRVPWDVPISGSTLVVGGGLNC